MLRERMRSFLVELASEMVAIGKNMNKRTVALITDMSRPLGMAVGNGLEMREAIQVLRGEVPVDDQLVRVCFSLAGNMLKLSGLTDSVETADDRTARRRYFLH